MEILTHWLTEWFINCLIDWSLTRSKDWTTQRTNERTTETNKQTNKQNEQAIKDIEILIRLMAIYLYIQFHLMASNSKFSLETTLRAVLWKSVAKLEMKNFNPLHFLCEVRLPGGINENSYIKVSKCVIAMVTAINHASFKVIFWAKMFPLRWFHPIALRILSAHQFLRD